MKKTLLKAQALVLALLMLVTALVSCHKSEEDDVGTDTTATTVADSSAETDIYEGLRDKDYGGRTFTILTYEAEVNWNPYIMQVEEGSQILNQATLKRNIEVQELLNVQIDTLLVKQEKIVDYVYTTSAAQLVDYDLVLSYATNTFDSLLTGDYIYNVGKVENMKLDKPWYNQSANQNFTIKKKQYFFVSDLSLPVQQRFAFLANTQMIEEYGVLEQFEGVNSIYDLVNQGKWTIDNLQIMIKNVNPDSASDDFYGTYGFATNENSVTRFLNNWGEDIVSTEYVSSLDTNRFTFNLNGTVLEAKVSRLTSLINDDNNVYFEARYDPTNKHSKNDPDSNNANDYYEIFKRGDAMFSTYSSDPWFLATDAGYQTISFAYLPYPKYTNQENYVTVTHGGVMMFPASCADISFAGAVTEALSAASYKYMKDAYKSNYFEARVIQEAEGLDMYQILLDTAYYDVARYVDPSRDNSGHRLCQYLLYFGYPIRTETGLDSRFKQFGSAITTAYTNLYAQLPVE